MKVIEKEEITVRTIQRGSNEYETKIYEIRRDINE